MSDVADPSVYANAVPNKYVTTGDGSVPEKVDTIINTSGLWQPGMTLFNYEEFKKQSLSNSGYVTVPDNKKKSTTGSGQVDQTSANTTQMKSILQKQKAQAQFDSTVTDNNPETFSTIENFDTSFVFPYNTAEKVRENDLVKQPYSAFVNALTCIMLLYFLLKTETFHGFLLIGSILLFELFHTFSHTIHLKHIYFLQTKILHSIALIVNVTLLYALNKASNKDISIGLLLFIILLLGFDNYAFRHLHISYYINTQIVIFFSIMYYYFSYIKKFITPFKIKLYITGFVIGYLAFMNETVNGEYMMKNYSDIPFHIIVEISIFVIFYSFASSFYKI